MAKPSAILTSLEDYPIWLDRALAKAYWEADYFLEPLVPDEHPCLFRLDRPSETCVGLLEKFKVQTFAIVTAFNPGLVLLPLEENLRRHAQLQAILAPHCRFLRNSTSQSASGDWREQGFWALDIPLEKAVEAGRAFGQLAIVCWERNKPAELWWLGN